MERDGAGTQVSSCESARRVIMEPLEFRDQVLERLTKLETMLKPLVGNGRPGAISDLYSRVRELEESKNKWLGAAAVIGTMTAILGAFLSRVLHL